ncbi:hypothetical protein OAS68_00235 [Candidatus Pelagibacter sp.]|nr:hypothetical protein [Candidatus Pelagibacter sp.]
MDQKKKEAITGLVVGLLSFYFLFYFNFDDFTFDLPRNYRQTIIGDLSMTIIKNLRGGWIDSSTRQISENLWWVSQLVFVLFIWYYRACIGHWFFKIIRMVYKKI